MTAREGSYTPPARALLFWIHVQRQAPSGVTADGQALEQKALMDALEKAGSGWAYDANTNQVGVKVPGSGRGAGIRVAQLRRRK